MTEYIFGHLNLFLCIALFISRAGDIGTTYLATPNLKLEANPVVRRFRWPFAFATLLICFLPFYSAPAAIVVMTASFLVAAANAGKLWWIRVLGEERMQALMMELAGKSKLVPSLVFLLLPPVFLLMLAGVLLLFYSQPEEWGFYFAYGIACYAFVLLLYGPLSYVRIRKQALRRMM